MVPGNAYSRISYESSWDMVAEAVRSILERIQDSMVIDSTEPRVLAAIEHVMENFTSLQRPSLESASSVARTTPEHFSRLFRQEIGIPFAKWQVQVRICVARELLQTTRLPVHLIGRAVGYDDPSTFGRVFKRQSGVSPSCLRQRSSY